MSEPANKPHGNLGLILLSVVLFEGGLLLAAGAWLWDLRHFPGWAAPWFLHPVARAFCCALGVLDLWAACDLLAEKMTEEEGGGG